MTTPFWHTYVAVGDSFSEGMCDESPTEPGTYVGWTDRLAAHLARDAREAGRDFGYANLAVRGRLLADVTDVQLPAALELNPDLVSIVGGGNDMMRPRADVDALAARLEAAVERIRATGADVLLSTPTDVRLAGIMRGLRPRHATYTAHIWSIARRHGCHVIDMWGLRAIQDWRLWAEDRIHMSSEGHRRVAAAAYEALGFPTREDDADWHVPLPPAPPVARAQEWAEHRAWVSTYAGPWLQRRLTGRSSGDAITAKRPRVRPVE